MDMDMDDIDINPVELPDKLLPKLLDDRDSIVEEVEDKENTVFKDMYQQKYAAVTTSEGGDTDILMRLFVENNTDPFSAF